MIRDELHYLATIDEVRVLAEQITDVGTARELGARARAAEVWARRAKLGDSKVRLAIVARLWAERRAGELLRDDPDIGPGKGRGVRPLNLLGISKDESSRRGAATRRSQPQSRAAVSWKCVTSDRIRRQPNVAPENCSATIRI